MEPGQLDWMNFAGRELPDMTGGWHFALHENAWNSASPNWCPFETTRPGEGQRPLGDDGMNGRVREGDGDTGRAKRSNAAPRALKILDRPPFPERG